MRAARTWDSKTPLNRAEGKPCQARRNCNHVPARAPDVQSTGAELVLAPGAESFPGCHCTCSLLERAHSLLRRRPPEPVDRAFIQAVANQPNLEGGHPSASHGVRQTGADECDRR